MTNATSEGFTGPYPTISSTPSAYSAVEAAAGSQLAVPAVNTEGHSELESSAPGPAEGQTSGGATEAGPSVNTEGHSELLTPAPGGSPEAAAGYSGTQPSVPATPEKETLPQEEAAGEGGETSGGRTGSLPNVAAGEGHSELETSGPTGGGHGETSG